MYLNLKNAKDLVRNYNRAYNLSDQNKLTVKRRKRIGIKLRPLKKSSLKLLRIKRGRPRKIKI